MKNKIIQKIAVVKPSPSWAVWFFPVVAVLITGWLTFDFLKTRGPLIELKFSDASSVEPQKTPVRYRGITVGRVESVELSENTKNVLVYVRLTKQARQLAVEGAQFWVVQPEVDFEGVRGLETIFRGPYIRIEPGKRGGKFRDKFVGHDGEPNTNGSGGYVTYTLKATLVESIDAGDPVSYRGMKVGVVEDVDLDKNGQSINVVIKVPVKYVKLIRDNTVFWKKSGVQADLGLFGAKVEIGSLENLMKGGVALATPEKPAKIANADSTFPLAQEPPKDWAKWNPEL